MAASMAAVTLADGMLVDEEVVTPEQLRSKSGVSLRVVPTTPKLGLGVVGKAS